MNIPRNNVYALLKKIPRGMVMTYSGIASIIGVHPRTVASALKTNKNPVTVPCYKVVHADGKIGGYSCKGGIKLKKELLRKEGISIKNGKIEYQYILRNYPKMKDR